MVWPFPEPKANNYLNVAINAITNATTNTVTEAIANNDQSWTFNSGKVGENVNINGNTFIQRATLNTKALLTAVGDTNVQQKIATELSQTASSLAEGISLSGAETNNTINAFISATINTVSNMEANCKGRIAQSISFNYDEVGGSINLTNNYFEQISSLFQDCVTNVISKNTATQTLETKIAQTATSTVEGLSIGAIIFVIILIIMAPALIAGTTAGAVIKTVFTLIFPVIIIAGVVLIGVGVYKYLNKTVVITGSEFSLGYDKSSCGAGGAKTEINGAPFPTVLSAATACKKDDRCLAMDWFPGTPGGATKTIFYTTLEDASSECIRTMPSDQTPFSKGYYTSAVFVGNGLPKDDIKMTIEGTTYTPKTNDIYIDNKTGKIYEFGETTWVTSSNKDTMTKILGKDWTPETDKAQACLISGPCAPGGGNYKVLFDRTTSLQLPIIRDGEQIAFIQGAGGVSLPPGSENNYPWSGYKNFTTDAWIWIFLGIALAFGGIIGIVVTRSTKSQEEKKAAEVLLPETKGISMEAIKNWWGGKYKYQREKAARTATPVESPPEPAATEETKK